MEIVAADPAAPVTHLPLHRSLPAAVADCVTYLEVALASTVPTDPHRPIPVPQTPRPGPVDDPARLIRWLGQRHPGTPVTVRLDRTGCTVHLHESGSTRVLATAAILRHAVATLGLPSTDPPR